MSVNPFLPPPSALSVLPKIAFWGINHDSRFSGYSIESRFSVQCHVFDMSNAIVACKHASRCIQKHAFACQNHAFACQKHAIVACKHASRCIKNMHSHVKNMPSWHANMHRDASKTCIRMSKTCHCMLATPAFSSQRLWKFL